MTERKTSYRRPSWQRDALATYGELCSHCGFGISGILEVAHIDHDNNNNDLDNLVILCPTCHDMFDKGIISEKIIREMRARSKISDPKLRMKDAGQKAKATKKHHDYQRRGKKAHETRLKHKIAALTAEGG